MVNSNKEKLKEFFFLDSTIKLRVRQLEKSTGLPLPSVIRYTKELVEEKILQKIVISNVSFYCSNRTSDVFLLEKKIFNLKQLQDSGLIDYLKDKMLNPNIILFGSYSKGEDIFDSDIDIFIESSSVVPDLRKYTNILRKKVQVFRYKSIKVIKNKDLANNIINGTILNGFIEVF